MTIWCTHYYYILLKTGSLNNAILGIWLALVAMVYEPLNHAREIATIKWSSGCSRKAKLARSINISLLFLTKETNKKPAPRWLSIISYPTRARGIIVKYCTVLTCQRKFYAAVFFFRITEIPQKHTSGKKQTNKQTAYITCLMYFCANYN